MTEKDIYNNIQGVGNRIKLSAIRYHISSNGLILIRTLREFFKKNILKKQKDVFPYMFNYRGYMDRLRIKNESSKTFFYLKKSLKGLILKFFKNLILIT